MSRMRKGAWLGLAMLAACCSSDEGASRDANRDAGIDGTTQSDGSTQPDASTRLDASTQPDVSAQPDAPAQVDGSTGSGGSTQSDGQADSTAAFDVATPYDAAAMPDGAVPIDDTSTPCRNFATLAFGVDFAGAGQLLATSKLGATVISPLDWSVQRTYAGHRGVILAAAISADGTRGASVGNDDTLRMWETATGSTVVARRLTDPEAVAFANGGSAVVVLDATGVHAFAWGSTSMLWSNPQEASVPLPVLASTANGAVLLAGAVGGGLDLLNAANGAVVTHLDAEAGAFSPDGTKLVTALDSAVRIVDVASPTQTPLVLTAPYSVGALAVGPNTDWVAVAGSFNSRVDVLSVPSGATLRTFDTAYDARTLSVSPDGRYIAAGANELYVFDVTDGTVAYSNVQRGMIWTQSFSPAAPFLVFARVGGDPEIWDFVIGRRLQLIPQPNTGNLGTVAFAANGDLLINYDDTGSYWLPGGIAPITSFTYQSGTQQPDSEGRLVFSPDGMTLAGPGPWTARGNLRLWNATSGALVRETPAHPDVIDAIAWSPDGQLIATTGGEDLPADGGLDAAAPLTSQAIKLWNAADGALVHKLSGHGDTITSVAFSPDGTLLASADLDGRVRLWSPATGTLVRELASPPPLTGLVDKFNGSIAFSPDGQFLASRGVHWIETGHSVYIAVFRATDGSIVRELRGFGDGNLGAIGWTRDGRYIVGGAGDDLRLWCM